MFFCIYISRSTMQIKDIIPNSPKKSIKKDNIETAVHKPRLFDNFVANSNRYAQKQYLFKQPVTNSIAN